MLSWKITSVTEEEWKRLSEELRGEARAWLNAASTPQEMNSIQLNIVVGNIAHLAYHLGAMRQIDRSARGPTAEEEARLSRRLRVQRSDTDRQGLTRTRAKEAEKRAL